jgi:hypothetical protein
MKAPYDYTHEDLKTPPKSFVLGLVGIILVAAFLSALLVMGLTGCTNPNTVRTEGDCFITTDANGGDVRACGAETEM